MTDASALVVVDIQNDFLPGGALAIPGGDEILPVVDRLMPQFRLVVATQDWHPADHGSFADTHLDKKVGEVIELNGLQQILWPVHCVQGTQGAEFAADLECSRIARVFQKGTDPGTDSYSGFFDNGHRKATGLGDYLRELGVSDVYVAGLATDYCVKFTALDACKLGFKTFLVEDACRGVDLKEGDLSRAIWEMKRAGVSIHHSTDL